MPRFRVIHTNFTAGEFSPLLEGRVDISKYNNACQELLNMVIMPQGGVERRGGFHYIDNTKDHSKQSRLIPFEYSSVQAYALEFGDEYIRFYMNGYQIKSPTGAEKILNGTFTSDLANWSDLSTGTGSIAHDTDHMNVDGGAAGVGWAEQSIVTTAGLYYCLRLDVLTNAAKVRIGTASGGEQILTDTTVLGSTQQIIFQATTAASFIGIKRDANGAADVDNVTCKLWDAYELASPWDEDQLDEIRFCQNADTLYIVHPDIHPRKLTRSDHDDWTLSTPEFLDGPYFDEEASIKITPSAATGDITMSADAPLWLSTDVGSIWRLGWYDASTPPEVQWGYVIITGVTDSQNVSATVKEELPETGATDFFREGSWSDTNGYPSTLGFFEDRLIFAGSYAQPQTIWGSKSGVYLDFEPGVYDNNAYYYTLGSGTMDIIRWLVPTKYLLMGTGGSEYKAIGSSNGPITPTNISITSETTHGSYPIQPLRVGNVVLFLQKAGRKIREFAYSWESDSYHAPDMTLLAEHLVYDGIKYMVFQEEPYSVVWVLRNDGVLLGMTYERKQDIVGWHQHSVDGEVESICVIPNPYYLQDELWAIIKRTVGGSTKRFIERIDPYNYTDSCLEYSGTPVSKVYGMDHLIGRTVQIVGDGAVYPTTVVDEDGAVTLDGPPAGEIEVGLGFTSRVVSLRPELQLPTGTAQGVKKHWSSITVRLFESIGVTINDELVEFRTTDDLMDEGVSVFTGDKTITNLGRDPDARVTIEQTQPLPLTVVCFLGAIDLGD